MKLLEIILGKRNNVKVLRHLIMHKDWQFNITELSKDIRLNKGVLSRLIEDLEKENIIKVSRKGKIKLFSINKENLFIKEIIIELFEKENNFYYKLLDKLVKEVKNDVVSVIAYGSVVSGKIKLTSDIDVLVIMDKENKELKEKINKIKGGFLEGDMLLNVDLIPIKEIKKLYRTKEPFVLSVLKNNKILSGKDLMEILE